jgi:hypothetical protein
VFSAPAWGRVAWRVARTVDGEGVIPDPATFLAGLDWRFARVSLWEPAVPIRLKGLLDKAALVDNLLLEVQALTAGSLPASDPLRPRQLSRVWKSGWATSVERALVLHRMLGQEKIPVRWVLTGQDPDPVTWAGLDAMLLVAEVGGETVWLDPGCVTCVPGEVSTRWMGHWALGGADVVPRAPGRLERTTRVTGEQVAVSFRAEGAAARWVREGLEDTDAAHRDARLATLLGLRGATVRASTGVEADDGPLTVDLVGTTIPHDPFDGAPTPWTGGVVDTLDAVHDAPH